MKVDINKTVVIEISENEAFCIREFIYESLSCRTRSKHDELARKIANKIEELGI